MDGMREVIPNNQCFESNKAKAFFQGSLFCIWSHCTVLTGKP